MPDHDKQVDIVPYEEDMIDTELDTGSMWYLPNQDEPGTIPLCKPCNDTANMNVDFELGMDLVYRDDTGNNEAVVYKGASADGLFHTV